MQQHSGSPLDWHEQHLFYLELESTRWRRLLRSSRHLLILATRLIQPDFDFAARYHVKQPMLVWVIRQLRLLTRSSGIVRDQSG